MGPPRRVGLLLLLALAASDCAGRRAREADRPFTAGLASVESLAVAVQPLGSSHVKVIARGTLPDACTRIDAERRERWGSRIQVTLTTRRESGALCAQVLKPFTKTILIPVAELHPGLYTLEVNGVSRVFDVAHDPELHDDIHRREPD
jgi:hypothetical protein